MAAPGACKANLPLPIAGPLLDALLAGVVEASRHCVEAAEGLGWKIPSAFQTLSFLALSVIPKLEITDRGLIGVDRFDMVPLARTEL